MNVFKNSEVANGYDAYYETEHGKQVNEIEEKLISEALSRIDGTKMLELGCGTGHWSAFFERKGFDLLATDVSEAMLKHARDKNLKAEITTADAANLPFDTEDFDVVTSITMLEFVEDKQQVLQEVYRVLKPGGYLLLGCLNAKSALAANAANDPVFCNAKFWNENELAGNLELFGKASIKSGVHFAPDFSIKDGRSEAADHAPAFLVALVQKEK